MSYSEQCGFLTVTAPRSVRAEDAIPVMVWLHGGGYVSGGGDMDIYKPSDLVTEQNVLVINVTYRIGALGFHSDGMQLPPNLGLLDVIAALQWIRRNIRSLGGDPKNVTVFGQSSGGHLVAQLLICEGAESLFRRAIIQSAALGLRRSTKRVDRVVARNMGTLSPATSLAEILKRQDVTKRRARWIGFRGGLAFGPRLGSAPLPTKRAADKAWQDAGKRVDLLIGSAAHETSLYLAAVPLGRKLLRISALRRVAWAVVVKPTSHLLFARPARAFARRHRRGGGHATRYTLSWAPRGSILGASHNSDIPLLLGSKEAWERTTMVGQDAWAEIHRAGQEVRSIWAHFARTGTVPSRTALNGKLSFQRL